MGLNTKGYGIHGTNVPSSIGKAASHGCIRMRQQDLEELFDLVNAGVTVELRAESSGTLAQVFAANSLN
jgi:lipoprotein-anchoring transpeptidase ErfK/SrfK